jgi:hypothetical protein
LGTYDNQSETFTSSRAPDGTPLSCALDHGAYGWSITNECDGRTLTFGWLAATCGNCKPQVAPQRLSLIRELRYDPRLSLLVSSPLPELERLHEARLYRHMGLVLRPGQRVVMAPASRLAARAVDLQVNLSLVGVTAPIVGLQFGLLSPDDPAQIGQGAVLEISVTTPTLDGSRNGTLKLWTDSYPAASVDSPHAQGRANFNATFAILKHETSVDIRALVDYSSVEAFVMGGRAVISLPIVPNCTEAQFAKDKCAAGQVQAGASVQVGQHSSGVTLSGMALYEMGCQWTADADSTE